MADEVQGTARGNNGERLELRVGTKSIGITSRDLLLFAFVAGIFVFIYINSQSNRDSLQRLATQLEQAETAQQQGMADAKALHLNVVDQCKDMIRDHNAHMEAQTDKLSRLMAVHEYNQDKPPDQRLPLELAPPR